MKINEFSQVITLRKDYRILCACKFIPQGAIILHEEPLCFTPRYDRSNFSLKAREAFNHIELSMINHFDQMPTGGSVLLAGRLIIAGILSTLTLQRIHQLHNNFQSTIDKIVSESKFESARIVQRLVQNTIFSLYPSYASTLKTISIDYCIEILGKISTNAFSAYHCQTRENLGLGIYSQSSFINHSCDPNAYQYYDHINNTISIIALRDIQNGEEITISYIDCENKTIERRQNELKVSYNFHCECLKCKIESDTNRIKLRYNANKLLFKREDDNDNYDEKKKKMSQNNDDKIKYIKWLNGCTL